MSEELKPCKCGSTIKEYCTFDTPPRNCRLRTPDTSAKVDVVKTPEFDRACRMYKQGLGGINDIARTAYDALIAAGVIPQRPRAVVLADPNCTVKITVTAEDEHYATSRADGFGYRSCSCGAYVRDGESCLPQAGGE